MISLYDYLGRAAGPALGFAVAKHAKQLNAKVGIREVSNPKYKGTVNLYERPILESFFTEAAHSEVIQQDKIWYLEKLAKKYKNKSTANELPF